jgi:hypothetical protein
MDRREFLSSVGGGIAISLSGCIEIGNDQAEGEYGNPPTGGNKKLLEYSRDKLSSMQVSGGVGKDQIPSVDNPTFAEADGYESDIFSDNIVFGVSLNGEQKAYPRNILTRHEIVNDIIGGENVSVTYCPLTGTAIGFKRGNSEFGVSGNLINNNLVMYDRGSDSRWPQMLGTAISGSQKGEFLQEFRVVWTTWDRWVEKYPQTRVLKTDTGYLRNYSSGAYGSYKPREGYYRLDSEPLLPSLKKDSTYSDKQEFIGARGKEQAYAAEKEFIREEKIVRFDDNSMMVYDETLDTGYIYTDTQETATWSNGNIQYGNMTYEASEIPANSLNIYDSMWFAWNGYYPSSLVKV